MLLEEFVVDGRVVLVDDSYGSTASATESPRVVVVDDSYGSIAAAAESSRVVVVSDEL